VTQGKRNTGSTSFLLLLAALAAAGLGLGIVRLISGLGTTTALSNGYPWGLWIVYDVFFVPFSAGAFMILAITHIYNRKEYHAIARPVVLAGFLGELMVIAVLVMDLGRWHQFYNVLFPWYWNIRSFMFQVSICLTIYMGVMVLEVAPAILERLNWQKPLRLIHMATALIAGLGVLLSSLHQSALGSLFLLIPYKLNGLWWTPILPLLFFVSAAFAGLCMAILVASLSFQAFGRRIEEGPLENLARIAAVLLGVYLVLKLGDVILAGDLSLLATSGALSWSFIAEILLGIVLPLVLFAVPRFRGTRAGLIGGSSAALLGIALNRTNVALLAYEAPLGATYAPHWIEVTISLAAIAGGVLLFTIAAYLLPILPGERPVTPRWSRRSVLFVGGMLSLVPVGIIALTLPGANVQAVKNPATAPEQGIATCADCHEQSDVLATLVTDPARVEYLTIAPEPPEKVHGSIRCVTCHYGQEETNDVSTAHQGVVVDPTLGEAQVCLACHTDLPAEFPEDRLRTPHDEVSHGQTAGVACSDCHGGVGHGFDPVSGDVICPMAVCLDCHQELHLDATLTECDACHITPHDPAPSMACSNCHQSTVAWQDVGAEAHPVALEGKHAEASCFACHTGTLAAEAGTDMACADCHEPPDANHYGSECQACHTTDSFANAQFEHPTHLTGAHEAAPCDGCHVTPGQPPAQECSDCHDAPANHVTGACGDCHTTEGWVESARIAQIASTIPHDLDGKADCLMCHDPEGNIVPALSNHVGYQNEQCTLCHKVAP